MIRLILSTALVLAVLLSAGCGDDKPVSKPAPVKVEQPKPPPTPPKVLNLGMTFEQFKTAYNAKIAEIAPETGWNIDAAQLQAGDVQDVFMVTFNENVVMMGVVDKPTRAVKEVMITATPKSENDGQIALLSFGLVIATLNPELNAQRRYEVLDVLKLTDGKVQDLLNGDGTTLLGNVRYRTRFDPSSAMFYFTASAKDL